MLDSSVYKQVPNLNSQLFEELVKYTRTDIYKLYIPEVVEREFISWVKKGTQKAIDDVVSATQSLNKYYQEPNILGIDPVTYPTEFIANRQINEILNKVLSNWNAFKHKTNATIIPIRDNHGSLVMDAYFEGGKPFNEIKNRNDIPDAFIYCAINDLLKVNETVIFVTQDKRFTKNIQSQKIQCFERVSDLLSSGPAKIDGNYFNSLDVNDKTYILFKIYFDEIRRKLVKEINFSDFVNEKVEDLLDFALGEHHDVSTSVVDMKFDTSEIKTISRMSILVPFTAETLHAVDSIVSKDELAELDDQRLKSIEKEVDDNGDFKVCEKHQSLVGGHFSVAFEDTDPTTWKKEKLSDHAWSEPEIKEISVSLEDIKINA